MQDLSRTLMPVLVFFFFIFLPNFFQLSLGTWMGPCIVHLITPRYTHCFLFYFFFAYRLTDRLINYAVCSLEEYLYHCCRYKNHSVDQFFRLSFCIHTLCYPVNRQALYTNSHTYANTNEKPVVNLMPN